MQALAAVPLQVAYLPVLPMAQLFIIQAEGWARDAGLDLQLTRFSSGPAMVQALASGKFDVAYVGIGPAMVARGNGLDLKVIAANGEDQLALLGRGAFAESFAKASSPAAAFAAFHQSAGRPVKIATLPKGSVPADTVLRYYLMQRAMWPQAAARRPLPPPRSSQPTWRGAGSRHGPVGGRARDRPAKCQPPCNSDRSPRSAAPDRGARIEFRRRFRLLCDNPT